MANKNHFSIDPVTEDQANELARFIIDEFGIGLSEDELDESIGVVMEDIPGIDLESIHSIQQLFQRIRRIYNGNAHHIKNQD